jgi:hypothetical protein
LGNEGDHFLGGRSLRDPRSGAFLWGWVLEGRSFFGRAIVFWDGVRSFFGMGLSVIGFGMEGDLCEIREAVRFCGDGLRAISFGMEGDLCEIREAVRFCGWDGGRSHFFLLGAIINLFFNLRKEKLQCHKPFNFIKF